jgi:hypothetical protein
MKIEMKKEYVEALINPGSKYKCHISLPFESETIRMEWFDWYMNEGQKQFFEYAKMNGRAVGVVQNKLVRKK